MIEIKQDQKAYGAYTELISKRDSIITKKYAMARCESDTIFLINKKS